MKNFKKIASIVLALVMVFALTSIAFAAETGSITVENPVKGQTYTIYKIFDLITYDNNLKAYRYGIADGWSGFVNGAGSAYVELDNTIGSIKWKHAEATLNRADYESDAEYEAALEAANDAIVAEFAKLALEYAKNPANGITAAGTQTAGDDAVEFTTLPLGYYLVDSSLGALCALTTTHKDAVVKEKNKVPTLDKQVQENSEKTDEDKNYGWGEKNDADIGEVVDFKITVDAKKGAQKYAIHDIMSKGLTLDKTSFKIYKNVENEANEVAAANYTIAYDVAHHEVTCTDPTSCECSKVCTFVITFNQDFLDTLTDDDTIIVKYSATLNDEATVAGEGNDNDAQLTYGDKSETTWDKTKTYTWGFDIEKYTNDGKKNISLAGAKFNLYVGNWAANELEGKTPIKFTYDEETDTYTVVKTGGDATITAGLVTIKGLDEGEYTLVETEAPAGYNDMAAPAHITISVNRTAQETLSLAGVEGTNTTPAVDGATIPSGHVVSILNQTGTELPSTGGIGTTIFYVVGGLLLAAAVILLVTRRRMATAK